LFEDAGFSTFDLGALMTGGAIQQLGAPLAGVNPDPARWSKLGMGGRAPHRGRRPRAS